MPVAIDADGTFDGPADARPAAHDEPAIREAAHDALLRGTSRTITVGDTQYFIEAYPLRPRLVVVGAVEVARSLVRLAAELGFETVVIDGRSAFATEERFPDVDRLVVGWPDEVAEEIGLGAADAVAVLTHDVKFDEPAIVEALATRLPVCRRGRVEEDAGRSPGAARRGGRHRRRSWTGCAARSGWTWVVGRRPRPRSRSSPRSSRSGTAGQACHA